MKPLPVIAGLLLLSAPALALDKVWIGSADAPPQEGRIKEDSRDRVVISGTTGEGSFPQDQVVKILYGKTPPEYLRAEGQRKNGRYEEAIEAYREALEAPHARLLEQYILYGLGVSLMNCGKNREATQTLEELLRKFPNTKFYVKAIDALIQLYLEQGMLEKVEPLLRELERYNPSLSSLIRGRISEKKNPRRAAEAYAKVIDQTGEEENIHWEAQLGLARLAFARKDMEEFQRRFQLALERPDLVPPYVLAEFYLLAARDQRERGRTDPAAFDQALAYYVRVFALYDTPRTRAFSAEALFRAAELAELLATKEKRPDLKKEARRLFSICQRRFRGTSWAKDAARHVRR